MGIMLLLFFFVFLAARVWVCMCMATRVCLDVCGWLWARVYCVSSPLVHYFSSDAGNLEHSVRLGFVRIHLPDISAKFFSFLSPFFLFFSFTTKYPSFMSPLPSVSLVTRQWTVLCPAEAALFCLSSLFYPCANRHGRVPELDPIFHAQLSFVWHAAPDKNPNSRASLILKSNSGVERAFNHPLSVLQWLPFNLQGPCSSSPAPELRLSPERTCIP